MPAQSASVVHELSPEVVTSTEPPDGELVPWTNLDVKVGRLQSLVAVVYAHFLIHVEVLLPMPEYGSSEE